MQQFLDFLSFKSFISLDVLIVIYYLGALGVPFFGWYLSRWIRSKLMHENEKSLSKSKYQTYLIFLFIIFFLLLELFWRVMFEFLIAYFQMRDVLVGLS